MGGGGKIAQMPILFSNIKSIFKKKFKIYYYTSLQKHNF